MMWEYAELSDGTAVAHSELLDDNTVEVAVEQPVDGGFKSAKCILPAFSWVENDGFATSEIARLDDFVHANAPLIMRLAREAARSYA